MTDGSCGDNEVARVGRPRLSSSCYDVRFFSELSHRGCNRYEIRVNTRVLDCVDKRTLSGLDRIDRERTEHIKIERHCVVV